MSGTQDNPVSPTPLLREYAVPTSTYEVIEEVMAECERQDNKWGEQNHDPAKWLAILAEEFGEAAKETVGITFAHPLSSNYRVELIQTAAVAIRIVESYDRRVAEVDAKKKSARRQKPVLPRAETKGQIHVVDGGGRTATETYNDLSPCLTAATFFDPHTGRDRTTSCRLELGHEGECLFGDPYMASREDWLRANQERVAGE